MGAPPMIWRSTLLNQVQRHCAGILGHPEAGDRSIFETGIAAHDVLHQVGIATNKIGRVLSEAETAKVANETCRALIQNGRSFEGVPEPPLQAERTFAGRDLAIEYLWEFPLEPGAAYETKLSADEKWEPTHKRDKGKMHTRWTGIVDVLIHSTEEDEEYAQSVLTVRDYKTNWNAGPAWLESLQARLYVCLALAHQSTLPNVLRLEVVNLRSRRTYQKELRLPGDLPDVESWQRDLTAMAEAIESSAVRENQTIASDRVWLPDKVSYPYTPGAGCLNCPAALECPAVAVSLGCKIEDATPESVAEELALVEATRDPLRKMAMRMLSEEPVEIPGGTVGYHRVEKRQVRESAYGAVAEDWCERLYPDADDNRRDLYAGILRNFLSAMSGGFGVSAIDNLAKVLHPTDMEARRAWLDRHIEVVGGSRFEIRKGGGK